MNSPEDDLRIVTTDIRTPLDPPPAMGICPECGSDTVYPENWEENSRDDWLVTLCCPNCDHMREGIYDQASVEEFDVWLDDCQDELVAAYRTILRENMSAYVDKWVDALNADAIWPMDF